MAGMAHEAHEGEKRLVAVDVQQFVRTRDALNTAFLGLSNSIDKAVKAYTDHTEAVLKGDNTLDVSYLTQPFNSFSAVASLAQHAMDWNHENGNDAHAQAPMSAPAHAAEELNGDEKGDKKRRKRTYKPRDPNAPKRPLTAYFRYLGEQRPIVAKQLSDTPNRETGKAGDLSRIATAQWHALSEAERDRYKDGYIRDMVDYKVAVAKYKAATGRDVEDAHDEEDAKTPSAAPHVQPQAQAAAQQGEDSSSEEDSDDSSDDDDKTTTQPQFAPPPAAQAKPTPKPQKKNVNGDTYAAPTPQFSSINPALTGLAAPPVEAPAAKKRKAPATVTAGEDKPAPKKRGRPSKADKAAGDAAAAAAQLVVPEPTVAPTSSIAPGATPGMDVKKPKKKRKADAAAAPAA